MKSAAFEWVQATDVDSALSVLTSDAWAKPMAGGQSLGPMLNLRLAQPTAVVEIRKLESLRQALLTDNSLWLGAAVTHAHIEDRVVPDVTAGLMPYVASNIAYRAIRNRGTLGGSLVHADPAADWISIMLVVDATMQIVASGPQNTLVTREVAASDWMQGPFQTALSQGELLQTVRIPSFSEEARWGYYKFCRKTGEFAEAIAAVLVDPPRSIYRLVLGATASTPVLIVARSQGECRDLWSPNSLRNILAAQGVDEDEDAYAMQMHLAAAQRALAALEKP
jgi:aerobic carbon-monoxide dehydrogenase medium subunit